MMLCALVEPRPKTTPRTNAKNLVTALIPSILLGLACKLLIRLVSSLPSLVHSCKRELDLGLGSMCNSCSRLDFTLLVIEIKSNEKFKTFQLCLKDRPWQSCAIFCKRKDLDVFYTPRLDLNNLPDLNPFYPDGTWCGNDGSKDYYCMQRNCIAKVTISAMTCIDSTGIDCTVETGRTSWESHGR